ncbi:hypothetical protein PQU92_07630 [Asticcacaulis sp. BYS171W]|uniref:UrcA family protein n=1 Tax=Asticcacaulis aquaticus TaxID=2984212 RepID=A0ABT5HSV3_9CAUL|nr:hypothetical protein [Asticcacaulis aquaticus]MDC7683143.1 hypothetical protein [Asticcacaulis aquaticus]
MSIRRALLVLSSLVLLPASALADTAYNDAIFVYDMNMKNVDIQLTGAQTHVQLGNLKDACVAMRSAYDSLGYALKNLDKAENAPVDAADKPRASKTEMAQKRTVVTDGQVQLKKMIDGNCPAA